MAKTNEFAAAHEAADVTVEAAIAACLTERADLRTAIKEAVTADHTLSEASAKSVEQNSFDLSLSAIRNQALVHLITERSKIAPTR